MPEPANNPFSLNLNGEGANILLQGMQLIPDNKKRNVVYHQLERDLKVIVTMWNKRIKEEREIQSARKKLPPKQLPSKTPLNQSTSQ